MRCHGSHARVYSMPILVSIRRIEAIWRTQSARRIFRMARLFFPAIMSINRRGVGSCEPTCGLFLRASRVECAGVVVAELDRPLHVLLAFGAVLLREVDEGRVVFNLAQELVRCRDGTGRVEITYRCRVPSGME